MGKLYLFTSKGKEGKKGRGGKGKKGRGRGGEEKRGNGGGCPQIPSTA